MKRGVGSCCRVRQICKNGVKNRRVHELMMSKKLEPGKENRAPPPSAECHTDVCLTLFHGRAQVS